MPFTNVTQRLGLPFMEASQAQKHLTYNAMIQQLDDTALALSATTRISEGSLGGFANMQILEESVPLSGGTVTSSIVIPSRMIVLGVTLLVTESIGGATSMDCGVSGDLGKFGSALLLVQGFSNNGVISPEPFLANTPVVITANGSDFTGGTVLLGIHGITLGIPS